MKEKKNIDNIFKEGFRKIETSPSPRVWENIQAELKKEKKNHKVIPLWMKLGGVAALLALLLTVGNSVYNSSDPIISPEITNENVDEIENDVFNNNVAAEKPEEIQVASEEKSVQNDDEHNLDVSDSNKSTQDLTKSASTEGKNSKIKIASTNSAQTKSTSNEDLHNDLIEKNASRHDVNNVGIASSKSNTDKLHSKQKEEKLNESTINRKKDIFDSKKEDVAKSKNVELRNPETISEEKKEILANTEPVKIEDTKNSKSIFDAIAEADEEKKEVKTKKDKPELRWNVAPNVAPVYYSSLGNGSSIDPTFVDNPQKGDINMSYGVQVSYALNKRLSVRTGVNNVDLSYSTADIIVGTSPVATALRSIKYGGNEVVLTAVDRETYYSNALSGGYNNLMEKSTQGEALLIQNINYYEVPVEVKYSILDSKLGLNLIGGLSTMFLGNNEISVKADNFNTVLGEANNLSSVSFSTNVGLGLDYKLSKKLTFNVEPMFKYQLNPYTDSSVSFKPYYLGVYSGLSFKF